MTVTPQLHESSSKSTTPQARPQDTLQLEFKQWVISAQENQLNTVPLSGFSKIFETAIHKTGATATYVTSMKDTNSNSFYIASNAAGTSTSYWLGLFK